MRLAPQNEKPYRASSHSGYQAWVFSNRYNQGHMVIFKEPAPLGGWAVQRENAESLPLQNKSASTLPVANVVFVILDFLHFKGHLCTTFRSTKLTNFTEH